MCQNQCKLNCAIYKYLVGVTVITRGNVIQVFEHTATWSTAILQGEN